MYYSLIFFAFLCHSYQLHTLERAKKSQKANLSRLVKPADLSQFSPAIASRQLAKPSDEGSLNSAWCLP